MPNYPSEHGDVFLLGDSTRQQLAYDIRGMNFSVQPNNWYMVKSTQTIYKGYAIAILTTNILSKLTMSTQITPITS